MRNMAGRVDRLAPFFAPPAVIIGAVPMREAQSIPATKHRHVNQIRRVAT
jgi:hypothetical protein